MTHPVMKWKINKARVIIGEAHPANPFRNWGMQNAKTFNKAIVLRPHVEPKESHLGSRLSILHPMPHVGPQSSPTPHPPTYAVCRYEQHTAGRIQHGKGVQVLLLQHQPNEPNKNNTEPSVIHSMPNAPILQNSPSSDLRIRRL